MSEKIEIKPCENKDIANFAKDMKTWLEAKAKDLQSSKVYLLSFHDDGVVWGKIKDDELLTSESLNDVRFPKFRHETLQELRLFGEKGQLHVWRKSETEFKASLALDSETGEYEFLQLEEQVLHGTQVDKDEDGNELLNNDFMIVKDGSEGLRHAFPLVDKSKFDGKKRPLRLHVKHYIEYDNDNDGCARIAFSRLVNVDVE